MNIRLAAALCLLASPAAVAQVPTLKCAAEAAVTKELADRHGEFPLFSGHDSRSGGSVMMFADPVGGTWTLMLRREGMLCGIGVAGDTWAIPGPLASSEEPT